MSVQALRSATRAEDIRAIVLRFDSPGGSVFGSADLAADVWRVAGAKPLVAYVEDMACSAALWVASQASAVACNETALVGSIGTYTSVEDSSGKFAKEGVKVHLISSAPGKGVIPGAPVSEEVLARLKREVLAINAHFVEAVAFGRRMTIESVEKLATGEVWVGGDARDRGLVDRVAPLDAVVVEAMQNPERLARSRAPFRGPRDADLRGLVAEGLGPFHAITRVSEGGATLEQILAGRTLRAFVDELAAYAPPERDPRLALQEKPVEAPSSPW